MTATVDSPAPTPPAAETRPRSRWPRLLVGFVVIAALVFAAGKVALGRFAPHLYAGSILQGDESAPPLDGLMLSDGRPADLSLFDGKLVIVYFGYMNCPDVCPTALSDVAAALDLMPSDAAADVQLVMVSVDPARDSLEDLGNFVGSFDPTFLGAGADLEAIDKVATQYGVYYAYGEGDVESGYTVDHTATLMGIDTEGKLRILWSPEVTRPQLAADFEALLD
ncbi:MAG: SCO family protein [Acidimicrobiales bacterium]